MNLCLRISFRQTTPSRQTAWRPPEPARLTERRLVISRSGGRAQLTCELSFNIATSNEREWLFAVLAAGSCFFHLNQIAICPDSFHHRRVPTRFTIFQASHVASFVNSTIPSFSSGYNWIFVLKPGPPPSCVTTHRPGLPYICQQIPCLW